MVSIFLLKQRLAGITSEKTVEESLPYEFVVLDAMLTKMVRDVLLILSSYHSSLSPHIHMVVHTVRS